MSHAELTAHRLYKTMHLDCVSEEVKRHLIILMLSDSSAEVEEKDNTEAITVPQSYEEALQMGAMELSLAREELHTYAENHPSKNGRDATWQTQKHGILHTKCLMT